LQEPGDLLFLARIERTSDDPAAARLDLRDERRELLAVSPSGEHDEAFGGKSLRDRRSDVVSRADHRDARVSFVHFHRTPTRLASAASCRRVRAFAAGPATYRNTRSAIGRPLARSTITGSTTRPVSASARSTLVPSGAKCLLPQARSAT